MEGEGGSLFFALERKKKSRRVWLKRYTNQRLVHSLYSVALRLESMDNGCSVHGVDWLRQRYCHPHGHRCRRQQAQVYIDVSK